jgi:opacity protein-like surface antigen
MRAKIFLVSTIGLILLCGTALAQDAAPKAELFGGLSYMRTAGNGNIFGWNGQVNYNVSRWFGVAGDFGEYFQTVGTNLSRPSARIFTFMVGPQLADRAGRITGFAHALFGGAKVDQGFLLGKGQVLSDMTSFSMALGGGVDANVNDLIAVRLFSADYLMIRANNPMTNDKEGRNNFRLSFGLVFKIK